MSTYTVIGIWVNDEPEVVGVIPGDVLVRCYDTTYQAWAQAVVAENKNMAAQQAMEVMAES